MRIRLEHKTLADGRFHVVTSPDLKGFHVSAATREEAEREAFAMLALIRRERGASDVPVAVEYSDECAA
jgi:hypothetical protein